MDKYIYNENEMENQEQEFDTFVQQIKKHSLNKKHSRERLNTIISYTIEENRNFEKEKKVAPSITPQKTNSKSIKEILLHLFGWGKPKEFIPRFAFLATIIIIATVTVFYFYISEEEAIDEKQLFISHDQVTETYLPNTDNNVSSKEELNKLSRIETQGTNYAKSAKDSKQNISENIASDKKDLISSNERANSPSIGPKSFPKDGNRLLRDSRLYDQGSSGFNYLKSSPYNTIDTILTLPMDSERGMYNFSLLKKENKLNNLGLSFSRYQMILQNFKINSVETDSGLVSNWIKIKNKNSFYRLVFKINSLDSSNIIIVKEEAQTINDSRNIRIITEKEYMKILDSLK